ncbi:hypothetical protein SNE40_014187 [Patella caerulea]|uniref:Uncharacterized protein n=1 Tax=Patella caerulea TaxID=87958 RepID=A0AAN8PIQ3_PATCE
MEFHSVFKEVVLEEMVLKEVAEVVETTTGNGYEADVDDDDDGYSDAEEWMFGDEEWLVSDPFLADMADAETFRPNVSSTPTRPTTPPPASIFAPFTDMDTLKSWYQPGSATPPPTPRKRKLYEDDDEDDDDEIRHVRQRLG